MIKTKKEVPEDLIQKVILAIRNGKDHDVVCFHNEYLELSPQPQHCRPCIMKAKAAVLSWLKENNHATFAAPIDVIASHRGELRKPYKWSIKKIK